MAALTAVNPRLVKGPVMETQKFYVNNGASWKAGQFLYINASGELNACASSGTAVKYYALEDQTDPGADDTTMAEVGVIHQDHVFEMNELNGTVSDANIGKFYALNVTSNVCTIDVDTTNADALKIVELSSDYNPLQNTTADTLARVRVKVLPAAIEAESAD